MTVSDSDRETIGARLFEQWADEQRLTIAFRSVYRRYWLQGFRQGFEVGEALTAPKRRSKAGG